MENRIRKLRESRSWTQEDLSKLMNVAKSTVAEWETDKKVPRPDKLVKLAQLFNTSVDYLLGNTDQIETVDQIVDEVKSNHPDLIKVIHTTRPKIYGVEMEDEDIILLTNLIEAVFERKKGHKPKLNGTD